MSLQNTALRAGPDDDQRQPISSDCRIWLGEHHEGRLGYVSGRGPRSVVVTYALVGDQILLQVPEYNDITQYAPGAKVSLAVDGEVEPMSVNQPGRTIDAITVTGTAALASEGGRWSTASTLFEEAWPAGIRTSIVSLPLTGLEVRKREPQGTEENLMIDEAFRHQVWIRLEPALHQSPTIESYLQAAADLTADVIEVVGSYSFCTSLYGNLVTIGTSDRAAWEADQVEFDTEDGPCVEALRTGTVLEAIDLAEERRWPAWAAVATLLGFSSAAGIAAEVSPGHRIALNLYAPAPQAFDDETLRRATLFTEEVARTIPAAVRLFEADERASQLEQALASRSTIDQALGVLMTQNQCTPDVAFGILRRASQNRNVKVRDVAATIIERFTGHPAADPSPFQPPIRPSSPRQPAGRPKQQVR